MSLDRPATTVSFAAPTSAPIAVAAVSAAASDVGKVRTVNEDAYFAGASLWAVADGMGGHSSGDVASALTVEACRDIATDALTIDRLAELIADVNHRVRAYAIAHDRLGMGCTMVGAAVIDNAGEPSVVVFNVGDSRCYVRANGAVRQVTTDHSYVQELVAAGELSPEDADTHPQRNVVTRAIGIDPQAAADFFVLPPHERAVRILLCSDGVHGELDRESLERFVADERPPLAVVTDVVAAVLAGRARDNLTAVIVDITLPLEAPIGAGVDEHAEITGPRPRAIDATTRPHARTDPLPVPDVIGAVPGIEPDAPAPPRVAELIDEVPT